MRRIMQPLPLAAAALALLALVFWGAQRYQAARGPAAVAAAQAHANEPWWHSDPAAAGEDDGTVYRMTAYMSPSCGCCTKWVDHMEANGFEVEIHYTEQVLRVKQELGMPLNLSSCHTAVVDGYLVEGHTPADLVRRMLRERPQIAGLAVPGMPMGSPGMEGAWKDAYDVIAFDRTGRLAVYDSR
jgi:hypothetical protein